MQLEQAPRSRRSAFRIGGNCRLAGSRTSRRQPDLHTSWDRNHRRRLLLASALISADTVEASSGPAIRIRPPAANSISITRAFSAEAGNPGSAAIATGLNATGVCPFTELLAPVKQLARTNPCRSRNLESHRAQLQRRRNDPILLRTRPAPATLHRRDNLNRLRPPPSRWRGSGAAPASHRR
jgi:hypothetical protein